MKMKRYVWIPYEKEIPKELCRFEDWEFSSGATTGEDFRVFSRLFKKFVKNNLPDGAELADFLDGHYFLSGFIKRDNNFIYFSISDVRHFPKSWIDNILIRTAKDENDYTGGSNCYTTLDKFKRDVDELLNWKGEQVEKST
ncbi:MAG: hypothetical protein ACOC5G_04030 [Acidobacteriota bacterium]